jgi:hypothetical protein
MWKEAKQYSETEPVISVAGAVADADWLGEVAVEVFV